MAEVEATVAAEIMGEDERVQLIGGGTGADVAEGNRHELVKTALLERWYKAALDDCTLTPETTFRLPEDTYL